MNVSTRKEAGLVALREALDSGTLRPAQRIVAVIHPAEIALLLESVPPHQRELVWSMVDPELEGDVLVGSLTAELVEHQQRIQSHGLRLIEAAVQRHPRSIGGALCGDRSLEKSEHP
ncbi:MAG: hypothetical protein FJ160_10595 [Gammaproteobacteria bacterium]|nr:hypothetical protein [Gammaproteobacteria bacterium]